MAVNYRQTIYELGVTHVIFGKTKLTVFIEKN